MAVAAIDRVVHHGDVAWLDGDSQRSNDLDLGEPPADDTACRRTPEGSS
jgi:hypothetical protein